VKQLPDDYTIRLVDMPISVGGRISEYPDGHIDVYINARLSQDGQLRAADHEFDHWRNDDLHNDLDIRQIEGRDSHRLPLLFKASDLLKKQKPAPAPKPAMQKEVKLTPYQARVLMGAVSELDKWCFSNPIEWGV
jgi:hypothetical protein